MLLSTCVRGARDPHSTKPRSQQPVAFLSLPKITNAKHGPTSRRSHWLVLNAADTASCGLKAVPCCRGEFLN